MKTGIANKSFRGCFIRDMETVSACTVYLHEPDYT